MKNTIIILLCAAVFLPASCTKDLPNANTKPVQPEQISDRYGINQNITMTYSIGREFVCTKAQFLHINFRRTGESLVQINSFNSCYTANLHNIRMPGTYTINPETAYTNGQIMATLTVPGFSALAYDPGIIQIEYLGPDRVKGSMNARLYSVDWELLAYEGVDTIFLTMRGSFEGQLEQVER